LIHYYEKDGSIVAIDEEAGEGVILSVVRLRTSPEDVIVNIDDADATFLQDDLEIDMQGVRTLKCDTETANHLIRMCFEIEAEEVLKADGEELSQRGEKAVYLINLLHGSYDSIEFDE